MVEAPRSVLIIAAHPDDCDVGVGGSAAKWAAAGAEVYLLVATNGNKGSSDPEMTSARLAPTRAQEQRAAARFMGIREVVIRDTGDGELEDNHDFRRDIVRCIRRFRPDRVVTHNPYRWQHRDHRVTGQVTLDAVYPYARDRLHYPELERDGLTPHKTAEVYLFGGFSKDPDGDVEEDITDFLEAKLQALACHTTQFGPPEAARKRWTTRWEERMKLQDGRIHEYFKRVDYPV
jgi:LmbE family N-acetylglucosaminyl deacetylase